MPRNSFHATIYKFEVTIHLRKIYQKPGLKLRPSEQTIHCTHEGEGTLGTRLCPTSFPGSSLFLPRGRKREDPENEVGLCLIADDVTILDISSFMNERYYFKLFKEFLDTCDEKRRMENASSFTERKQNMTYLSSKALTVNYALAVYNDRKKFREETKALKIHRGPILAV